MRLGAVIADLDPVLVGPLLDGRRRTPGLLQQVITPVGRPDIGKIAVMVAGQVRVPFQHLGDDRGAGARQAGDIYGSILWVVWKYSV